MINWKVLTESIRLTDDINLREQTDEDGDVFHWWIHQAKKGVFAAQVNGFLNQSGLHMFESKYLSSKFCIEFFNASQTNIILLEWNIYDIVLATRGSYAVLGITRS